MSRLDGKICLITGAARGIGRCCAEMMLREGARVAISDIDGDAAQKTAAQIGGNVIALPLDVTSLDQWHDAIATVCEGLGGLNVLVNNAGIIVPGSVESLDEDGWDRTIDVDLKSVFLGCKAALPAMAASAPGAIVNISSISAMVAGHNMAAYNAAKAGVHLLSKSVALH
ncbi:MAG: SDR family NAD(P)-dependent oxidoreductase, partial [Aestuariivirgaceae bacterium]